MSCLICGGPHDVVVRFSGAEPVTALGAEFLKYSPAPPAIDLAYCVDCMGRARVILDDRDDEEKIRQ